MTLKKLVFVFVMIMAVAGLYAAAVPAGEKFVNEKGMTYEDCYDMAAEQNLDYKMAKMDKAVSEAQFQKAIGGFGPTVSISGGYEPVYKASTLEIPAGVFGPTPISMTLGMQNYYSARVSLTQPIFTFGKTYFGFMLSQEAYKIAQTNFKKAGEKLKLDTISAFYGALITKELYNTQVESTKSNEEFLKITKAKYANGQASNFEVLQAQLQYANSLPDRKKAEDTAKLALKALKNTLGMDVDTDLKLSGLPEYKKLEMTYADVKKIFKKSNDDRETITAAANIASYQKKLAIAMLLPNIVLSANYNYYSASPSFHSESKYWDSSWDATVGMQWTIFDSFKTEAGIKEAAANEEKAKLNKENMDNLLEIQLDQIYMAMDESAGVIEAAADLIKTAQEGLRIAKESYKNGLIQSVDLMNAEINLLRAKTNYLNALNTYTTNMQKLKNYLE